MGETLRNVLVVDDDESVLKLLIFALSYAGYRPIAVRESKEALEIFKKHRDQLSFVVAELALSDSMSGSDLASQLLFLEPDLKMLLIAGHQEEELSRDTGGKQNIKILPRPFTVPTLIAALKEIQMNPATPVSKSGGPSILPSAA
jgi:DNA-binding NtrC family response regulator